MNISLYLAFIAAAGLLIAIPGPNILLIVSNSLSQGKRLGFYTVLGTSTAMVIQLMVAVTGLTAAMGFLSSGFEWFRWLGVAYLLYLGWRHWMGQADNSAPSSAAARVKLGFWQGFLVSLTNPKTMLFFAAFFPQFADSSLPMTRQLIILAVSFWCMAMVIDSGYMLVASRMKPLLENPKSAKLTGRVSGSFVIAAALGLALVRRQ